MSVALMSSSSAELPELPNANCFSSRAETRHAASLSMAAVQRKSPRMTADQPLMPFNVAGEQATKLADTQPTGVDRLQDRDIAMAG